MSAKFPRGGGAGPFLARSLNVETKKIRLKKNHDRFHHYVCIMCIVEW